LPVEGVAWLAQRFPTAINLGFLDWSFARECLINILPELSDDVGSALLLKEVILKGIIETEAEVLK
jgi:hypothetical protein